MIRIPHKLLKAERLDYNNEDDLYKLFQHFGYSVIAVADCKEPEYHYKYEGNLNSNFKLWILGCYSITGKKVAANEETFTETFVYHRSYQLENDSGIISVSGKPHEYWNIRRSDDPEVTSIFKSPDLIFRKMNPVAHYTKMGTVIEHILPENRLLINNFRNSNDPWEYRQNCYTIFDITKFCDIPDQIVKAPQMQEEFFNRVRFTSFTKDTSLVKCFDHPGMWAHYGQNHKGMCLVFDLQEVDNLFKDQFKNNTASSPMKYGTIVHKPICLENEISLEDIFKEYAKDLFFEKMKDWKNEEEFRFVSFENTEDCNEKSYLQNIDNALIAIIAGANFDNTYKSVINEYLTNRANNNKNKIDFYQLVFINGHFRIKDLNSDNQTHLCNEMLNDYIIENV